MLQETRYRTDWMAEVVRRTACKDEYAVLNVILQRAGSVLPKSRTRACERQESPAEVIDAHMKTFHEWLDVREGLWLNDKNAVIGLLKMNPLPRASAVYKSLRKKPKPSPSGVPPRQENNKTSRGSLLSLPICNHSSRHSLRRS
ncbi:MAG: hypothetical protein JNL58_12190 [Planctomyces sp.]|nr:hypothetical protein [Planctomyces sp.]